MVWDRLFRLKQQGVTLILTTHYMDEAEQLCDRLVVMDGGKIAAEGSPRALIDTYSTREVLELRFGVVRARAGGREVWPMLRPSGWKCWPTGSCCTSTNGDEALAARPRRSGWSR